MNIFLIVVLSLIFLALIVLIINVSKLNSNFVVFADLINCYLENKKETK